ncbi:MAG: hypothetical protein A3G34_06685 [Candidatus Lindowbacteria bacterium RIFCSPLOWO2_12_FULL_62_27]|nr:MAG: hypothetical protein A3G34_06685 [Candidatus Lindowbacteria bacterium RIFCSPLOWO2_12_FULL_62_27]
MIAFLRSACIGILIWWSCVSECVHAQVTATASSEDNAELAADRAVDGNVQTRWSSKFEDKQWLEIDLGEARDISGLYIFWEAAYAKEYDVQVSTDRADWSTVHSTRDGRGGTDKLFFSGRPVRYVKIDCLKRGTDWGNSIYEVQFRSAEPAAAGGAGGMRLLEDFESTDGWAEIKSQGAEFRLSTERGPEDKALGLNFEFPSPLGYVVAGKDVDLSLPEDYKLSFLVKGEGPPNTIEFKLMDEAGNTYWKKFEEFEFPPDWKEISVRKKQVVFAWGPSGGGSIRDVRRIEFGVSCGQGGKGRLLIDKLSITDVSASKTRFSPSVTASTSEKDEFSAARAVDGDRGTRWSSLFEDGQWLELDLGEVREFVGLTIHWEAAHAKEYDVSISTDRESWTRVYTTDASEGGVADLYFKKRTARYIRIDCRKRATGWGNSIWEVELKGPEEEVRLSASSSDDLAENALDGDLTTAWSSGPSDSAWIMCDLGRPRDIGAVFISWSEDFARSYDVYFSRDLAQWDRRFSSRRGNGGRDRLVFKDLEARYVMIHGQEGAGGRGIGVREIEVKGSEYSGDRNTFYEIAAEEAPRGFYPKYFSKQQSYWTVVGVSEDKEEALINEEGAFEVGREQFSVEPFVYVNDRLITWADVTASQSLEKDYLPIPSVQWTHPEVGLTVQLFAHGPPGGSSMYAGYRVSNPTEERLQGKLFLAIRPFQVNPPWQTLNQKGGVAIISSIEYGGGAVSVNGGKKVIPLVRPAGFGAVSSASGDVTDYLQNGRVPPEGSVTDGDALASGALEFPFDLGAGESAWVYLAVPFHDRMPAGIGDAGPAASPNMEVDRARELYEKRLAETAGWWDDRLSRVTFKVPEKAQKFVNALKSNLAYIFINRDGYRIQPGSRSYLRSWIRDGAMTSSAILRMGNIQEVREYLSWYAPNLFEDGRVPCVVDDRGADGTPENDSNGEFIYGFLQYYYFTQDKAFLREHFPSLRKAADFIIQMRNQRKTDEYKNGGPEKRMLYGLVPESISHEGYSAKPAHSHWDNFFSLKGLKDAATICEILGESDMAASYRREVDDYRACLYDSIRRSMEFFKTDFIPGAADLGDFDATSTSIGVFPCGELGHIPQEALIRTFDKYYADLEKRLIPGNNWGEAYTPYEIRSCRTFMIMGQKDRAAVMFDFFFNDCRPRAWNHWAEVVWRLPETPRFIGDMPHTWIGSDYMNTVRSMFVYEQEEDRSLILGAGIFEDWLDGGEEVGIERAPTYWGSVNFSMKRAGDQTLLVRVWGDAAPPGKIYVRPPLKAPIRSVKIDQTPAGEVAYEPPRTDSKDCASCPKGSGTWASAGIRVDQLPADIQINY